MDIRYRLTFRCFRENFAQGDVTKNLTDLFELPIETVRAMVANPGATVEEGLTLADAARLQATLEAAGAICVAQEQIVDISGANDVVSPVHDAQKPEAPVLAVASPKAWSDPAAHLRAALNEDKLRLYCQPITTLGSGAVEIAEVFVRLREEENALLPPGDFLPVFEQFGMLPELDKWVVQHVIDHLRSGSDIACFSINLSGPTLADVAFPGFVADALKLANLPAAALLFEIDEADVMQSAKTAESFALAIRSAGCRVLIDSFARSAVSFASLRNLTVDFVKVDGSIVRNILKSPDALSKMNAVLRVGEVIGVGVIAECVEEPEILVRVKQLGAGYAQGYGIVEPHPIEHCLSRVGAGVAVSGKSRQA